MKRRECSESERLTSSTSLSAADQSHLSSCSVCREHLTVASAMSSLAAESRAAVIMPPAQVVFVRARILGRRRLAAASARPLIAFQKVAYAVIAVCWIAFMVAQWTPVTQWLGGIEISTTSGITTSGTLPLSFFWMCAALSLMTMMTMVHGLWTDGQTA